MNLSLQTLVKDAGSGVLSLCLAYVISIYNLPHVVFDDVWFFAIYILRLFHTKIMKPLALASVRRAYRKTLVFAEYRNATI